MSAPDSGVAGGRRRLWARLYGAAWIGYWLSLFVVMHIPIPGRVTLPTNGDKLIHFMGYGLLTLLGGAALAARRRPRALVLACWGGIYGFYAVFDEWSQQFVHRTPSVFDWLADGTGILVASLLLVALTRRSDTSSEAVDRPGCDESMP